MLERDRLVIEIPFVVIEEGTRACRCKRLTQACECVVIASTNFLSSLAFITPHMRDRGISIRLSSVWSTTKASCILVLQFSNDHVSRGGSIELHVEDISQKPLYSSSFVDSGLSWGCS